MLSRWTHYYRSAKSFCLNQVLTGIVEWTKTLHYLAGSFINHLLRGDWQNITHSLRAIPAFLLRNWKLYCRTNVNPLGSLVTFISKKFIIYWLLNRLYVSNGTKTWKSKTNLLLYIFEIVMVRKNGFINIIITMDILILKQKYTSLKTISNFSYQGPRR